MDNVLAALYPLPAPLTPAANFLNGFVPTGKQPTFALLKFVFASLVKLEEDMMEDDAAFAGTPSCSECAACALSPYSNMITRVAASNVYSGWQFNATKPGNYKVVPSLATVGGLFATFYDRDSTAFAFTSAVRSSAVFGLDFSAASGNAAGPLLGQASIRWQGYIQPKQDGVLTLSVVPHAAASQDKVKVLALDPKPLKPPSPELPRYEEQFE
jgi:hypothetical protein